MLKRCGSCFHEYDDKYQICPECGYAVNDPAKELFYLQPGTLLADRYRIGKGIGHGGFGITYLAWDTKFDVKVAIKEYYWNGVVNRVPGTNEVILFAKKKKRLFADNFNRFIDEARNMAKFSSHRNIVNVFEYFEENGTAYIVMEYLSGCELEKYVEEKGGKLPHEDVLAISEMVCTALKALHNAHIIHRDIAPDNIIIEQDGNAKLIDFGAARFSSEDTVIKRDVVKPGYSPLEQYNETSPQGPWSDIYSLGAMMYKLLTGEKPDEATDRDYHDNVIPPHDLDSDIPEYLSNVVMRAMAMDSFLRFQSIEEMEKGLFRKKKVNTPEQERRRRKRKRVLTIAGCGVAAAGIALVLAMRFFSQYVLPADITVWYVSEEDNALNQDKINGLETITEDFKEIYPQVDVELVPVDSDEYVTKLEEALVNGNAPDLFESAEIDSSLYGKCSELTGIVNESAAEGCCFLDQYETVYPDGRKMPVGFQIPVMYINQSICKTDYTLLEPELVSIEGSTIIVEDRADGKRYTFDDVSIAVNDKNKAFFERMFPDSEYDTVSSDAALFERKAAYYFGNSESYLPVISSLPGQIIALNVNSGNESESIGCIFDYEWSIYPNSSAKEKAAGKLLAYMLTENAQEEMMVRNQCNTIPLQQNVIESYSEVYESVFSNVNEETEKYVFETR